MKHSSSIQTLVTKTTREQHLQRLHVISSVPCRAPWLDLPQDTPTQHTLDKRNENEQTHRRSRCSHHTSVNGCKLRQQVHSIRRLPLVLSLLLIPVSVSVLVAVAVSSSRGAANQERTEAGNVKAYLSNK